MFQLIRHMLELVRFSHTLFALPFAVLAAVMAWSENCARVAAGRLAMDRSGGDSHLHGDGHSAAMAFNRLADERIDAENPRTRGRHLPAGLLSRMSVALFAAACSAGFIAATLLFLPNRLPLYLSLPVLAFLLAYSFTKRFTALSHFWLGAALMLAPVSAWIAIRGAFVVRDPRDLLPAVVLGGAVLLWVAGFDMIYACQDVEFDRRQALKSMPVRLGVRGALRLAAACHAGTVVLLGALPLVYNRFGWVYWTGVAAVAALLVYEHCLVRPDDLTRVNRAFFNVNAVISLGLLAVATADLVIR